MKKYFYMLTGILMYSLTTYSQTACSLDNSFDTDGLQVADGSRLGDEIVVQDDEKIIVACNPFGNSHVYLKRLNTDGTTDMSYGTAGRCTVQVAEKATRIDDMFLYNGNVYVCGTTSTDIGGTNTYPFMAAINSSGQLINTFGTGGIKTFSTTWWSADALTISDDGKLYVAGSKDLDEMFIGRFDLNGNTDNSFNTTGYHYELTGSSTQWYEIGEMALDNNNQPLVTGKKYSTSPGSSFWKIFIMKFTTSGALDNTFLGAGIGLYNSGASTFDEGHQIHVTPTNEYIVCGNVYDNVDYDYLTLKTNEDGNPVASFGAGGFVTTDLTFNHTNEYCLNSALMPDGRILLTGNYGDGDTVHFSLLMLKADGTRDNTFAANGLFMNIFSANNNSSSSGMCLTPNGKIVMAGYTRTCSGGVCGPLYMAVSRYLGGVPQNTQGVNENPQQVVQLYPNPSSTTVYIKPATGETIKNMTITNMQGQVVYQTLQEFNTLQIDVASWAKGIYTLSLQYQNQVVVKKFVVD